MKYSSKDLLTWLISLFILSGCTNPTGIGLEVDPEEQIDALFTDTVSIRTYTLQDDSVQSAAFDQTTFGLFRDPIFGTTQIDLALDLLASPSVKKMSSETIIDSVILVLPYGNNFYGDTLASTFTLQVRQLDEIFTINSFSSKSWSVRDEVLGSVTLDRYAYKPTDSLRINRFINDKDSLVRVAPQLRIPLSKEFFKTLMSGSEVDSATLANQGAFRTLMRGLYLQVDSQASTGIGGLVAFRPQEGVSGVELTYRQPNGKTGEDAGIDTVRALLEISSPFQGNQGFMGMNSAVQHSYSTEVSAVLADEGLSPEQVYLQAPTGLRAKIVFPEIDHLKDKNLVINKAELVLWVDQEAMAGPFTQAAPRLTLYRQDIAGIRQNIPDGAAYLPNSGTLSDPRSFTYLGFGGWHQSGPQRYVFHITSYIQDVLQGKINGNELYVAPVAVSDPYVPVVPALNAGGRVVLGGHAHPDYQMKLNLYYTEVATQ